MKFKKWVFQNEEEGGYHFYCPGCEGPHTIATSGNVKWSVTNADTLPIVSPSIKVTYPANPDAPEDFIEWRTERICHSYIGCNGAKPGQIIFLNDCTHHLAGKVVDLPEYPIQEISE